MIQLIAGCKAIHSEIFEDEDGVQDANSSFSLDQSLISSAHWKRKSLTNTRKQTARDLMEYTRSILGLNANLFFVAKNGLNKKRNLFWTVGWAVDHDWRLRSRADWQIDASSWWPSDHRSTLTIWFHHVKKRASIVDRPLDFDPTLVMCLMSPPIACNLSRYNLGDRRPRLIHLSELIDHVLDYLIAWTSVHAIDVIAVIAVGSNVRNKATCPAIIKKVSKIVPHRKNNEKSLV